MINFSAVRASLPSFSSLSNIDLSGQFKKITNCALSQFPNVSWPSPRTTKFVCVLLVGAALIGYFIRMQRVAKAALKKLQLEYKDMSKKMGVLEEMGVLEDKYNHDLKSEKDLFTFKNQALLEQIKKLNEDLAGSQKDLESAQNQVQPLKAETTTLKSEKGELTSQNEALSEQIETLNGRLAESQKELKTAKKQLQPLQVKITTLQDSIGKKAEEVEKRGVRFQRKQKEEADKQASLSAENAKFRTDLAVKAAALDQANREKGRVGAQLRTLNSELEVLREENQGLKASAQQVSSENDRLKAQIKTLKPKADTSSLTPPKAYSAVVAGTPKS